MRKWVLLTFQHGNIGSYYASLTNGTKYVKCYIPTLKNCKSLF